MILRRGLIKHRSWQWHEDPPKSLVNGVYLGKALYATDLQNLFAAMRQAVGMRAPLTRELVINTAREQLESEGIGQLSLRGLARQLGVTAPALYAYVEDKDDLLEALATEHFERLVQRFDAIEEADPVERIRALSRAYVFHALSSPALFHLMFRYPPTPVPGMDAFPPSARAFEAASAATSQAIAAGQIASADPAVASMTMWAAIHGVAEVLLLGFTADEQASLELMDSVINTVLAGQIHPLEG